MLCPVCDEEMLVIEYNGVEIDYCYECAGIWLDEGELELLLGNTKESPVLRALINAKSKAKTGKKCPVCAKKMTLIDIPISVENNNLVVEIDKCPRNHGLWFDKGELEDILSYSKGEPVAEFLSGIFT